MSKHRDEHLPDDLQGVADELRSGRTEASAVELDEIKRRAMARASRARTPFGALRARTVAVMCSVALLVVGLTAVSTSGARVGDLGGTVGGLIQLEPFNGGDNGNGDNGNGDNGNGNGDNGDDDDTDDADDDEYDTDDDDRDDDDDTDD